jgi:Pilus assembly protein, PilO
MTAAPQAARTLVPSPSPAPSRRRADDALQRLTWAIGRTGRAGLAGIALLLAAAVFLFSTYLPIASEVRAMRADVAAAKTAEAAPAADKAPVAGERVLPARAEMPTILRQIFSRAAQAGLAVDNGKYELLAGGSSGIVRYQIELPITGPYPQIRSFIDATLASMPAVALNEITLDRKTIGEGNVDAQIRMTVYTGASSAIALNAKHRVASASRSAALFAPRSWYVAPPPPPPTPEPPAPEPTAPPLPFTFVGSFTPEGHGPVYFLARGDRVIDAHVGDRIDGVYKFESAESGQLVFVYLPLNVRQIIPIGGGQ